MHIINNVILQIYRPIWFTYLKNIKKKTNGIDRFSNRPTKQQAQQEKLLRPNFMRKYFYRCHGGN